MTDRPDSITPSEYALWMSKVESLESMVKEEKARREQFQEVRFSLDFGVYGRWSLRLVLSAVGRTQTQTSKPVPERNFWRARMRCEIARAHWRPRPPQAPSGCPCARAPMAIEPRRSARERGPAKDHRILPEAPVPDSQNQARLRQLIGKGAGQANKQQEAARRK